jgi:hypothetical protein
MKISREDLYRRVWETPLTKLAKEFDISDVGLAKACRKHSIPTPPVGHWAKVAHGKPVLKPALPKSEPSTVDLNPTDHRVDPPRAKDAEPAIPTPAVTLRRDIAELAGTAESTHSVLSKAKPDTYGFVRSGSSQAFACVLSVSTINRAALVLDAIERSLPDAGIKLIRDRDAKCITLEAEGERMTLSLVEGYTRTEHVTVDPKYHWKNREYSYAFNGSLKLALAADFYGRRTWSDGVRARLEEKIGAFLVGIVEAARGVRAQREAREEQRRKWEEDARLSRIAAEHSRRLKEFKDNFVVEAAAWQRYQEARAYLDHLKRDLSEFPEVLPAVSAAWLAQAEVSVEGLNPGIKRVQRLLNGYESSEWRAPFGDPIVSSYPGFG